VVERWDNWQRTRGSILYRQFLDATIFNFYRQYVVGAHTSDATVDNITRYDPVMASRFLQDCVYGQAPLTPFCDSHDYDCGLAAAEAFLYGRTQHLLQMLHWERIALFETNPQWHRGLSCNLLGFPVHTTMRQMEEIIGEGCVRSLLCDIFETLCTLENYLFLLRYGASLFVQ
jgi:hypothetical protein